MNNLEFEKKLAESGFTGKDIAAMRQYLGQDGATYLSLLSELRGRFILSMVITLIILLSTIYEVISESTDYLYAYLLMWLVIGPVIYFMTPVKLGFKAFKYKLKN